MIRPSTVLWVALTGAVGFGLYHLKQEVQKLEDNLFRVNRAILTEQEAIHVLRAEWAYINQPTRLQAMAQRHLELRSTKPTQLGTLATLPSRAHEPVIAADNVKPTVPPAATLVAPKLAGAPVRTMQGVIEPASLTRPALAESR